MGNIDHQSLKFLVFIAENTTKQDLGLKCSAREVFGYKKIKIKMDFEGFINYNYHLPI